MNKVSIMLAYLLPGLSSACSSIGTINHHFFAYVKLKQNLIKTPSFLQRNELFTFLHKHLLKIKQ